MRRTIIGVMGPGAADEALEGLAFELGAAVAREGWILLTGGRRAGVMDAASRGAKTVRGSITLGILPGEPEDGDVSEGVDIAVFTNMGDARNAVNVQSSDVVVACGAATPGTLSEVALALKSRKHVILMGGSDRAQDFLKACGGERLHVVSDAAAAIVQIKQLGIRSQPSWNV